MWSDKCEKTSVRRGDLTETKNIKFDTNTEIRELIAESSHKNPEKGETNRMLYTEIKEKITRYHRCVISKLKSVLEIR